MIDIAAFKLPIRPLAAVLLVAALAASGCAQNEPGPRLREIERFSEMTDDEIAQAREDCHAIATTDHNCASLNPATPGMSTQGWKEYNAREGMCRKAQELSFNACLRVKGVRYAEFH